MNIVNRPITVDHDCTISRPTGDGDAVYIQSVLGICVIRSEIEGACGALVDGVAFNHGNGRIILRRDRQVDRDGI